MTEKKKIKGRKKQFADALLTGKAATPSEAARVAKYKDVYGAGHRLMKTDDVRQYMMQKFEDIGITNDEIAFRMKDGLDAMTPPKKEGGTRYEDFFTRRLYLDMYFRLRGLYAPEKTEHIEKRIVINMTPELIKGLKDSGAIDQEEVDYIEGEVIEQASTNP